MKKNIRVKLLGNIDHIRKDSAESLRVLESVTKDCTGLVFQICVAYGGRDEIVRACKQLNEAGEEISEENIAKQLDSSEEPDLIIRTGGHKRLSNFLMWQSAYSELYFLDIYWPEFTEKHLVEAIAYLKDEERNFGK